MSPAVSEKKAAFRSVLYPDDGPDPAPSEAEAPAFFVDLNLDQIVARVTAGRERYDLAPFFYAPLTDLDAVRYRQEVFRDLGDPDAAKCLEDFASAMRVMWSHVARSRKAHHPVQKQAWFLDAMDVYCDAVGRLLAGLSTLSVDSRALRSLRGYLAGYVASEAFHPLLSGTKQVKAALSEVRYCVRIKENRVTVTRYEGEADYSAEVLATFDKFKQGAVKDYRLKFHSQPEVNPVEGRVLDLVGRLYPDTFGALARHCQQNQSFVDPLIARFEREIQFYLAYKECVEECRRAGLSFCYPEMSTTSKEITASDTFDLALAIKLFSDSRTVVTNDFYLTGPERIIVVSGPNQGGKTTFARAFGQLHYLAALGCPVPGREAGLRACRTINSTRHCDKSIPTPMTALADSSG